jgi:hypothetical protein
MPFVDQRTILRRMAAKDLRVNAAYAAARRKRLAVQGVDSQCNIDRAGQESAETLPAPNRNERPLQEVPILAKRDSTPDNDPATVQNETPAGNSVAPTGGA